MFSRVTTSTIKAKFFTPASRTDDDIRRIVMHTSEGLEQATGAENLGEFFHNLPDSTPPDRRVSSHYGTDSNSVVGYVDETDIAHHALGDNTASIGIEMVGKAAQSREDWGDDYSRKQLALTAELCADICKRRGIPVRFLSDQDLRENKRGFASHDAISRVFGANIRDDPGKNFPWQKFLSDVQAIIDGEDDMVRFTLELTPGEEPIAQSSPVDEEIQAEKERLGSFLSGLAARDEVLAQIVRDLRDDGVARLRRVQAD